MYFEPFHERDNNYSECFNELTILGCCYHLFIFTDFVGEPTIQYKAGWSIITIVLFNIIVNFIKMIRSSIINTKRVYQKYGRRLIIKIKNKCLKNNQI